MKMITEKSMIRVGTLLALLCVATVAQAAGTWSSLLTLTRLDDYGEGIDVHGISLTGTSNPRGCAITDRAFPVATLTPERKAQLTRTLMAAFLAGRQVQLKISDSECSPENTPVYYAVSVR